MSFSLVLSGNNESQHHKAIFGYLFLVYSSFGQLSVCVNWSPSWGKACLLLNQNIPTHTFTLRQNLCPFGIEWKPLDSSCGIQRLVRVSLD